jgi:type VI protein secretion system component Hcp
MKKLCLSLLPLCLSAAMAHAADTVTMTTSNQIACSGQSTNTISLTAWQWGTSSTVASNGLGKPSLSSITLSKSFDDCSAPMLNALFAGTRLTSILIEQAKPSGNTTAPLAEITLTNAYITSYSVGGSSASSPTESWALSFDKICVTTYGQTATGQSSAGSTVCYGS